MSIRDLHYCSFKFRQQPSLRQASMRDRYIPGGRQVQANGEDGRRRETEDSVIKMEALLLYDLMIQRRKLIQL